MAAGPRGKRYYGNGRDLDSRLAGCRVSIGCERAPFSLCVSYIDVPALTEEPEPGGIGVVVLKVKKDPTEITIQAGGRFGPNEVVPLAASPSFSNPQEEELGRLVMDVVDSWHRARGGR